MKTFFKKLVFLSIIFLILFPIPIICYNFDFLITEPVELSIVLTFIILAVVIGLSKTKHTYNEYPTGNIFEDDSPKFIF